MAAAKTAGTKAKPRQAAHADKNRGKRTGAFTTELKVIQDFAKREFFFFKFEGTFSSPTTLYFWRFITD